MKNIYYLLVFILMITSKSLFANEIEKYEYWYDSDYAEKQTVNISSTEILSISTNLNMSIINNGLHTINYRFCDESDLWSSVLSSFVYVISEGGADSSSITKYEYWINNDYSSRVIENVIGSKIFQLNDSILFEETESPFIIFNIRFQSNIGLWSKTQTSIVYFDAQNYISQYEYWVDDSQTKTTVNLEPSQIVNINENLMTGFLPEGIHFFNIRFKSRNGLWSSLQTKPFHRLPSTIEQDSIIKLEYWVDDNYSNKIIVDYTPNSQNVFISLFDLSSLTEGVHIFNSRYFSAGGAVSPVISQMFNKFKNIENNCIVGYKYKFGNYDTKYVRLTPPANPYQLDTIISFSDYSLGKRIFQTQFLDSAGNWSYPANQEVTNTFKYIKFGNQVSFILTPRADESYFWEFGDGDTDSIPIPKHFYRTGGVYNVTLTITDSLGNQRELTREIQIKGVQNLSLYKGGNTGDVTFFIYGAYFHDSCRVWLEGENDEIIYPDTTVLSNSNTLIVQFDFRGKSIGQRDFVMEFPNDTIMRFEGLFMIEEGKSGYSILYSSRSVRAGQTYNFPITINNLGNVDMDFPIIILSNTTMNPIGFTKDNLGLNISHLLLSSSPNNTVFNNHILSNSNHEINIYSIASNRNSGFSMNIPSNSLFTNNIQSDSNLEGNIYLNDSNQNSKFSMTEQKKNIFSTGIDFVDSVIAKACNDARDGRNDCTLVPDLIFSPACAVHDECYERCCVSKFACDWQFFHDLVVCCNKAYPWMQSKFGARARIVHLASLELAAAYFAGVNTPISMILFNNTQKEKAKPQPCNYPKCSPEPPPPDDLDDKAKDKGEPWWENPTLVSRDPNEISGPKSTQPNNYIQGPNYFPYRISFENVDSATAPAQIVVITNALDKTKFDMTTFQLSSFAFGDTIISVPQGLNEYTIDVDLRRSRGLNLRIDAKLDTASGIAKWQFISLDTNTRKLTEDVFAGFLPPNDSTGRGEGSVSYTIKPLQTLANGTEVKNKASIVFDYNEPILTNEWLNTIDNCKPWSIVNPLDSVQQSVKFNVNWAGDDATSDVEYYNIYYSVNDGQYMLWKYMTDTTAAEFTGMPDSTYRFYCRAIDYAGNIEDDKTGFDAITIIRIEHQGFNLAQGWNTISSYIIPDEPTMENIWGNYGSLVLIKNNLGNFYYPEMGLNSIGDWNNLEGYQSYLSDSTYFYITGTKINPQTPIPLVTGWNIMPYLRDTEMSIQPALFSLGDSFILVKDNEGNIYFPLFNINSIGNMKPGQGYLIYMLETGTLVYPE